MTDLLLLLIARILLAGLRSAMAGDDVLKLESSIDDMQWNINHSEAGT